MGQNKNKKNKKKHHKPEKKKRIESLHIMQVSLRFSNADASRREDIDYAFAQEPDLICFGEAKEDDTKAMIRNKARASGYAEAVFSDGDSQLAVKLKGRADARLKSKGGIMSHRAIPGSYGNRFVRWARVAWFDQDVWMHAAHWVFIPHVLESHGELTKLHTDQTTTMCNQVKKHGQGDSIAFFAGDINVDEGADNATSHPNMPNFIFRQKGLLTIWDELHVNPPITVEHSTFDIIGCYRPDKQVEGKRYVVHPKQNSDHRFVSAYYDIDVGKKAVGGGGGGDGGDGGEPDDTDGKDDTDLYVYANAGNIDWSDYLDNEIYKLPTATGDSQYGG